MSMISIEGRPKKWSQVHGQEVCKTLLKTVVKDPDNSPKCLLVYGSYGSGKTTCARILAAELNHMNYDDLTTSPFLVELDSSALNKDNLTSMIDNWYAVPTGGYRVIVLDEVHLLSDKAMSALLKVFEETPRNTFFYLATTDVEKVLDTIRSRCLEIKINPLTHDEMKGNIEDKSSRFGITVTEEVMERIIQRSKGHPRTADMELSKYEMLGEEQYLSLFKSSYDMIDRFFVALAQKNKDAAFKAIDEILQFPLITIKDDMDKWVLDQVRSMFGEQTKFVSMVQGDAIQITSMTQQEWFKNSFTSDVELQTALLVLYQKFNPTTRTMATSQAPVRRSGSGR